MGHIQAQIDGPQPAGQLTDTLQRQPAQTPAAVLHSDAKPVQVAGRGGRVLPRHVPLLVVVGGQGKGPRQTVPLQQQVKLALLDVLPHKVPGIGLVPNTPALPVHAGHQGGVHLFHSGQI